MQDEVNEKTVSLCIRCGKVTANLLKAAMKKALAKMEQYETGNRTPRESMLNKMAAVLEVDPRNISIPTGYREEDMIYRLLALEDYFPEMKLERNSQTGDVTINLHNKKLNDFLFTWGVIRGKRAKGLISEEEYLNWKYKLQIV